MSATTAGRVVEELRRGPATTGALAEALGLSRNGVECALRRAQLEGHRIANVRAAGDRRGALYVLAFDADHPHRRICAEDGCGTVLADDNHTPYCRRHLPLAAVDRLIAWLEQDLTVQLELV